MSTKPITPAPNPTTSTITFPQLLHSLRAELGPTSGIDSEDVDEHVLQDLMSQYISDEREWKDFAFADPKAAYTRNLVDRGTGGFNLLVLVWSPGRGSAVHDHANAHCIMKILKGSLTETRYAWPTTSASDPGQSQPLEVISEKRYEENRVAYMSDELGIHRIANPSSSEYAVSLHLYTPPNAANFGCNVFNEKTGHSTHLSKCAVHSEYGKPVRNASL